MKYSSGFFALALFLSVSPASAKDKQYRLTFPDKATYLKASISLHHSLVRSEPSKNIIWAQLSEQEKLKLAPFVVEMMEAPSLMSQALPAPSQEETGNVSSSIAGFSCYPTVEETQTQAVALMSQHPKLVSMVDIGDSWKKQAGQGGYDLNVFKLTNHEIAGDKPKLFIHAAMHAREYATSPLALAFMQEMISSYDTDADSRWILDNQEIHLLLHMNPDGRKQAETGLSWRKNHNETYCSINPDARGADLNRNFSYSWGTVEGGSSGDECSNIYRGPVPASEPETQAVEAYVKALFGDHRGPNRTDAAPVDTQGLHIDIHSYSELVLWPWGDVDTPAPNGLALQALGRKLAKYNGYTPIQSVGLYPTDGTSDSVTYGELGVPHMTFELGTAFFQSCSEFNEKIKPDNLKALKYAAKIVSAPYLLPSGPDITSVEVNGSGTLKGKQDQTLALVVKASDAGFNNRQGTEPTQNIKAVELYIDSSPFSENAQPIMMASQDGSLDSVTETLEYSLALSGLELGRHTLYFRAKDSSDTWGAVTAKFVQVESPEPVAENLAPVADYSYQCDGLSCEFDASSATDSDGTISEFNWLIGEESKAGLKVSHTFAQAGTYGVSLVVTDDKGATHDVSKSVSVEALPVTPVEPEPSSSSGGALHWLSLLLLAGFIRKDKPS